MRLSRFAAPALPAALALLLGCSSSTGDAPDGTTRTSLAQITTAQPTVVQAVGVGVIGSRRDAVAYALELHKELDLKPLGAPAADSGGPAPGGQAGGSDAGGGDTAAGDGATAPPDPNGGGGAQSGPAVVTNVDLVFRLKWRDAPDAVVQGQDLWQPKKGLNTARAATFEEARDWDRSFPGLVRRSDFGEVRVLVENTAAYSDGWPSAEGHKSGFDCAHVGKFQGRSR